MALRSSKSPEPAEGGNALVLLMLVFLAYLPALRAGLVWDDVLFVGADWRNTIGTFADIWSGRRGFDYFPLTYSSFWLERHLFGDAPFASHLLNVLLHGVSAILLARVLARLRIPGAYFAAAIFAVHPLNVTSVAWISERKNVLSLVFYLLSVGAYLGYLRSRRRASYLWAMGAFVLALLAKPSTVALPVALLICAWWEGERPQRRDLLRLFPFAGLALVFAVITIHFQYTRAMGGIVSRTDGAASRIAIAARAIWFYWSKIVAPFDLSLVYPRWDTNLPPGLGQVKSFLPLAGLLALAGIFWKSRVRWGWGPLLALAFFVSHVFPVLGFFQMSYMRFSLVADHLQYLPAIGIVTLLAATFTWAARRAGVAARGRYAAIAVVVLLGGLTFARAKIFESEETLWRATLPSAPDVWVVHHNLGDAMGKQGRHEEAIQLFRNALRLAPYSEAAHAGLGEALLRRGGSPGEAVQHLQWAMDRGVNDPGLRANLALAQYRNGEIVNAVDSYRAAIDMDPKDSLSLVALAEIFSSDNAIVRDVPEALRMAERACQVSNFANHAAVLRLARINVALGRCDEAKIVFAKLDAGAGRGQAQTQVPRDLIESVQVCAAQRAAFVPTTPIEAYTPGYARSSRCQSCHERPYADWYQSHHRTMTQMPAVTTVVGDFGGQRIEAAGGARVRPYRRGSEYWMDVEDPVIGGGPPPLVRRKVSLLTGSNHQQAYWYETGQGNQLALLPIVYLIGERRWVPEYSIFVRPPAGPGHLASGTWNQNCLLCHTTQARPRVLGKIADTQAAELGIACEACHGPGLAHVENEDRRALRNITNPRDVSAARSAQICGYCHSVQLPRSQTAKNDWNLFGRPYEEVPAAIVGIRVIRPARDRDAGYIKEIARRTPDFLPSHFWPDGMIRVTGREYNGLIDSPCYSGGKFSCLSCHDMHRRKDDRRPLAAWTDDQLAPGMEGDGAQCHAKYEKAAVLTEHTHHEAKSPGSRCMNCHMPNTTYGLLKATRSHQISSPMVASDLAGGRPNACNLCHLDKPLRWAANALESWYRVRPSARLSPGDDESLAAGMLWALQGDAGMRALVAWSMGWQPARQASGSDWMVPPLAHLLEDPYAAVRFIAGRSLRTSKELGRFDYDFVGPVRARAAISAAVLAGWQARAWARQGKPEVLVQPDGTRDDARFSALARRRDDRPVNLRE